MLHAVNLCRVFVTLPFCLILLLKYRELKAEYLRVELDPWGFPAWQQPFLLRFVWKANALQLQQLPVVN
jgi:hypothetical protein